MNPSFTATFILLLVSVPSIPPAIADTRQPTATIQPLVEIARLGEPELVDPAPSNYGNSADPTLTAGGERTGFEPSASHPRSSARRALLIGINSYQPGLSPDGAAQVTVGVSPVDSGSHTPPSSRRTWTDLEGCVNDVLALRELLVARYDFQPENIVVLTNAAATRAGIFSAFERALIDPAAEGDLGLFYFAGHGSQVVNSKSLEADGMDESIVPADAWAGAPDIRDKELRRLYRRALRQGLVLTAIVDSCHSGSIARGLTTVRRVRYVPPDLRDVADPPDDAPDPEELGLLVISASQDHQNAFEIQEHDFVHGAFSLALLKVLRALPADECAETVFSRIRTTLQAHGWPQEPVLAANTQRRGAPLLGGQAVHRRDGGLRVAVQTVEPVGHVQLQGGRAVGLNPGAELTRVVPPNQQPDVRLRVVETMGLVQARACVIAGSLASVSVGDLFEMDKWGVPEGDGLRLWLPPATPASTDPKQLLKMLEAIRSWAAVEWVEDPIEQTPTHVLAWSGAQWVLETMDGTVTVAQDLTVPALREALVQSIGTRPRLFCYLPPGEELRQELERAADLAPGHINFTAPRHLAHYLLVGRFSEGRWQHAWVQPDRDRDITPDSPLPARSDWFPNAGEDDSILGVAAWLNRRALRLARLKAWLCLESPPDTAHFPYRLALRNSSTGEIKEGGEIAEGDSFALVLRATAEQLRHGIEPRFVYSFVLDSHGNSTLLFPPAAQGNVENRVPIALSTGGYPTEIRLGPPALFSVGPPFGIDTYVLLTTAQPLVDPTVLESAGVRTRGRSFPLAAHPLERVLSTLGVQMRASPNPLPIDWSIQRSTFSSLSQLPSRKRMRRRYSIVSQCA
jgi:hypothetical protein